ncbi:MAG: helix-turn-helix transcriptional regulator [Rhizobiales bacterium]|nr:helix-turn-helix domain-containing protein [Hyphomicrobiales bacterium]NRB13237.1 helix-turn-helix transcriptional regulator [Hyphomicrobiales bacterium]
MLSLLTASQAQESIAKNLRTKRLGTGLTQAGLADRSGVSLPSLRRFEQSGNISLESLLKLLMTLNSLEQFVQSTEPISTEFSSIDDVLNDKKKKTPKKGWRK